MDFGGFIGEMLRNGLFFGGFMCRSICDLCVCVCVCFVCSVVVRKDSLVFFGKSFTCLFFQFLEKDVFYLYCSCIGLFVWIILVLWCKVSEIRLFNEKDSQTIFPLFLQTVFGCTFEFCKNRILNNIF